MCNPCDPCICAASWCEQKTAQHHCDNTVAAPGLVACRCCCADTECEHLSLSIASAAAAAFAAAAAAAIAAAYTRQIPLQLCRALVQALDHFLGDYKQMDSLFDLMSDMLQVLLVLDAGVWGCRYASQPGDVLAGTLRGLCVHCSKEPAGNG